MAVATERATPSAGLRRPYGELDRAEVVAALRTVACRVGAERVTMRELAAELGAAVPSVYYHVPGKRAALELLAESVLSRAGATREVFLAGSSALMSTRRLPTFASFSSTKPFDEIASR